MTRLFTIGKVIQVREDPLYVRRLAFIETEEHIRHVVEMLRWLYPDASSTLRRAAELHDIGKKIYLRNDFVRGRSGRDRRLTRAKLSDDFYGCAGTDIFNASEAIQRYLSLLGNAFHTKCFPVREDPSDPNSPIIAARYQLDPPFGNHAASVETEDLRGVAETQLSYVHDLIRLHHNFQVDKLVASAAEHGNGIILDLYCLMTADQEGSRWSEYVAQTLEGGQEAPPSMFGFSEFGIEAVDEAVASAHDTGHVRGEVKLRANRRPDLDEHLLITEYYVVDCNLNPGSLPARKRSGGKR